MSERQVKITTRRPNWLERVWYRRLGELAPTATGCSGPWHADLVRLLPYRWRRLHQLYAFLLGFYWLPCPLCGREYGGHEHGASIQDPDGPWGRGLMICSQCTIARNEQAKRMMGEPAELMALLTRRQRRKVAKRPVMTECGLTPATWRMHWLGTCKWHGDGTERQDHDGRM